MSVACTMLTCALPPQLDGWRSLVNRSIAEWDQGIERRGWCVTALQRYRSLDQFLENSGALLVFWFFQRRSKFLSQTSLKKWSRDNLDDYVLLPAAPGFVTRDNSFFVSHFWRTKTNPDPDGSYLRMHQAELKVQEWSYIWVDWTCMPQSPRSESEAIYFSLGLRTMSGIIRNAGFTYFYPPFEPRLWILYEIAEYRLTSTGDIRATPDIVVYLDHIAEMLKIGVQATLTKHGYKCSNDEDRQLLISLLELMVLLCRLNFKVESVRCIKDHLTWRRPFILRLVGIVEIDTLEGTLTLPCFPDTVHRFTPLPQSYRLR